MEETKTILMERSELKKYNKNSGFFSDYHDSHSKKDLGSFHSTNLSQVKRC